VEEISRRLFRRVPATEPIGHDAEDDVRTKPTAALVAPRREERGYAGLRCAEKLPCLTYGVQSSTVTVIPYSQAIGQIDEVNLKADRPAAYELGLQYRGASYDPNSTDTCLESVQ
jgi:hypothetical protein